jgi:exonuclease SbcD
MRTEIKGIVRKQNGKIDYEHLLVELKNAAGEVEALCLAVPFLRQGDYPVVETEGNPYAEGVKELYARLLKYALKKRTGIGGCRTPAGNRFGDCRERS